MTIQLIISFYFESVLDNLICIFTKKNPQTKSIDKTYIHINNCIYDSC